MSEAQGIRPGPPPVARPQAEPPHQDLGGYPTSQERTWATFCHLAAFTVLLGVPLGLIAGPLVVWLIKRNDSTFVDRHGKAALNFQLSVVVYGIIIVVLGRLVLHQIRVVAVESGRPLVEHLSGLWLRRCPMPLGLGTAYLLFPLLVGLVVLDVVCTIVAAVRANTGRAYRYPLTIPFIR